MPGRPRRPSASPAATRGRKTAPAESGTNSKKKKKNVKEIDGILWLLDDSGNPVKKVRKKGTKPEEENKKKPKKNIVEIDGQLYLLDENGKPSKKVRKKGERAPRGKSVSRIPDRGRGRGMGNAPDRRRAQSMGAALRGNAFGGRMERQDFVDDKGRRVIIEPDGSKTVIDKNGKRLRPKRKKVAPTPAFMDDDSVLFGGNGLNDNFLTGMPQNQNAGKGEAGMFDKLWDDGLSVRGGGGMAAPSRSRLSTSTANAIASEEEGAHRSNGLENRPSTSLSSKISELSKENRELSLKLLTAEEQIQETSEQHKREKAKNVKAMTEMMQLKADYTEASSEIQKLRAKIKDLDATIEGKDRQTESLKGKLAEAMKSSVQNGGGSGHGNKEVEELYAENRALQRKLEFERTEAHQETKKNDDKLVFMTKEIGHLKEELDLILSGKKEGFMSANPVFLRVVNERKELQTELEQEREKNQIRIQSLQETIDSLEKQNRELRKRPDSGGLGKVAEDDVSIDFVTGLPRSKKDKKDAARKSREEPVDQSKINKHIGEIQVNFNSSFDALEMNQSGSKGWFGGFRK